MTQNSFDVKIENKDTGTVVFDEAEEKQVGRELRAYASAWEKNFKTSNTATYHVTLALPASTGNDAADKTAQIEATVYAVQFNADVQGDANVEWFEKNEDEFNTNIDYIVKNGADVVIKNGTWDGTKLGVPETETFAVHGDVAGKQTKLILENVDLISGSYGIGIRNYTWVEKSGKILILRMENGCFQPFFLL